MELRDIIAVLRARYRIVLGTMAVTLLVATGIAFALPKTYTAETTLLIGNGAVTSTLDQALLSQRLSVTYAQVAVQRATLQRVIDKLKLDIAPDKLADSVSADAPTDSSLVHIIAKAGTAKDAAAIANGIADDLIAATPAITGRRPDLQAFVDENLKTTRDEIDATRADIEALTANTARTPEEDARLLALQNRMATLQSNFASLVALGSGTAADIATVSDPAVAPDRPSSPNIPLTIVLAAVAGLLGGIALALIVEQVNDRIRTADDVQRTVNLPTLAAIGRMRVDASREKLYWLATVLQPRSTVAEAYRSLRTNVEFASIDRGLSTLLVTSAVPQEGKTTVACNLAVAFAQAGKRTILVDADLRRPAIQEVFGVSMSPGLTDALRRDDDGAARSTIPTETPNLRVMSAGTPVPNPAELLGSPRMRRLIDRLRADADLVIFDSPPLQLVTDAAVLGAMMEGAIIVADTDRTTSDALRGGVEALRRVGAPVIGVVLNRVQRAPADAYGTYGTSEDEPPAAPIDSSGRLPVARAKPETR